MTNKGKYESKNPAKRLLLNRFLGEIHGVVASHPGELLDVGVGEGLFWDGVDRDGVVGIDIREEALAEAGRRGVRTQMGSALDLPFLNRTFDIVIAIEILEHLFEPERAVAEMARVTRSSAVVSVPWEPWFSLMVLAGTGSHPRRLGREPEHVQAFGPRALAQLLEAKFAWVSISTCFPWIIGQARQPL